jgi:hypothetical protein
MLIQDDICYDIFFKVRTKITVSGLSFCFKKSHLTETFGPSDSLFDSYSQYARPNLFPDTNYTKRFRGFLRLFGADYTQTYVASAFLQIFNR